MTRTFVAGDARVVVDEQRGGRLSSFQLFGVELLVPESGDPLLSGCYPMVPWAGRVRHGRFAFAGQEYRLPLRLPPHAIHGTVLDRVWNWRADDTLAISLGDAWPFGGEAVQRIRLEPNQLVLELEVHSAAQRFPATIGWHPWFRRRLERGLELRLDFVAKSMFARDEQGLPTGEKIQPSARPWDDCFTDVENEPVLEWPGFLRLELASNANYWVIYDEPEHAVCVEPQTGPPDGLNLDPDFVSPAHPLRARFVLSWSMLE